MSETLYIAIIETGIALIVEGIILAMVFNWIANKETSKTRIEFKKRIKQY